MTYRTRAGRQFVLASTGAGADASLVAFALPDGRAPRLARRGQRQREPRRRRSRPQSFGSGSPSIASARAVTAPRPGDAGPRLVPFSREYDELLGIVREGAGQMPPISARELSDEGVAQVLAYLKSLSR